jgi:WD40 repeat protein
MSARLALAFAGVALGFLAGQARQSAMAGSPRPADRYGDPLPPGVVARLGSERLTLANAVFLTFSPDGRRLAAHSGFARLRVWDVNSGQEVLQKKTPQFHSYGPGMNPIAFSPDSKAIALGCPAEDVPGAKLTRPPAVRIWEVATGKELHHISGLKEQATHLAFSRDGRYLFGGGYGLPLLRWDLHQEGAATQYGSFTWVAFLAVSGDGKRVTAGTVESGDWRKRTFACWEVATGKEIGRHSHTLPSEWTGELSPEGSLFAAPDVDAKSIALLDPMTGREVRRAREVDRPACISFSADAAAMTCSSKDGVIRVWSTVTGKPLARFKALPTGVKWAILSPDGKRLALSGRADDAVHVWDVAERHRVGELVLAALGRRHRCRAGRHPRQPQRRGPPHRLFGGRPVSGDGHPRWHAAPVGRGGRHGGPHLEGPGLGINDHPGRRQRPQEGDEVHSSGDHGPCL